jgi:phage tail protein X
MATILRTCDGDLLDTICHGHYGRMEGTVEAVYAANPGLAAREQPFAAGVIIRLPDLPAPRSDMLQLWS